MADLVRFDVDDGVGTIRLDRPPMNAIDAELLRDLRVAALEATTRDDVRAVVLGGGCELAMCADLRYSAEDAQLGQPEIKLGVIPGAGGTQRLPRLVGLARAKEIIYSGRMVPAKEALDIGLVDAVFPADQVYERSVDVAREYAKGPGFALRAA